MIFARLYTLGNKPVEKEWFTNQDELNRYASEQEYLEGYLFPQDRPDTRLYYMHDPAHGVFHKVY